MDCSPPCSSVHGILQARILEWVAISFSEGLPNSGFEPGSPTLQADSLPSEPWGKHFGTFSNYQYELLSWCSRKSNTILTLQIKMLTFNLTRKWTEQNWNLAFLPWWAFLVILHDYGLPMWLSVKEPTCQSRRCGFNPWVGKILWRRKCQHPPVFLPGKSHGQSSLVGYSPQGCKESDMT